MVMRAIQNGNWFRRGLLFTFVIGFIIAMFGCEKKEPKQPGASGADDKIELRILYVGTEGSGRQKEFTKFLKSHFRDVQASGLEDFQAEKAQAFDVVIFDYDRDAFKAPRPDISSSYSKATVTVGVIGALICDSLDLKPGYL